MITDTIRRMLNESDLLALAVTVKLAFLATSIFLLIGAPFAWWMSRTRWRYKFVLEALVALPLVLPPTVLGFYLLISLGPHGPLGGLMVALGGQPLAFTFTGLVIGSVIYSMPFVIQPLQDAFTAMGRRPLEVAATLGASPLDGIQDTHKNINIVTETTADKIRIFQKS